MSTSTISREKFLKELEARNPGQPEFIQAVAEVIQVILPYIEEHPEYQRANILERIVEPERVLMFHIPNHSSCRWQSNLAGKLHQRYQRLYLLTAQEMIQSSK